MEDAIPRPGGAALRKLALLDHVPSQATCAVGTARAVPHRSAGLGPLWPGAVGQADRKSPEYRLADRGRGAADRHIQARRLGTTVAGRLSLRFHRATAQLDSSFQIPPNSSDS